MNIITNYQNKEIPASRPTTENIQVVPKEEYKPDILDLLSKKVINQNDLNDMVTTPRAIFKGYLCFTIGASINTIGNFIKNEKISKALQILGCISSIYGTYNFVKPYLVRQNQLTKDKK